MRAVDAASDIWTGDKHSRPKSRGTRTGHAGAAASRCSASETDRSAIRRAHGLTHIARANGGPCVERSGAVPVVRRGVVEALLPDRGAHGRAGVVLHLHAGERGAALRRDLRQNRRGIDIRRRSRSGGHVDDRRPASVVGYVDARGAGVATLIRAVSRIDRDRIRTRCERHGGGPCRKGIRSRGGHTIDHEACERRNRIRGGSSHHDAVRGRGRVIRRRHDRDHRRARILCGRGGDAKSRGVRAIRGGAAIIIRRAAGEAAEGHTDAARRLRAENGREVRRGAALDSVACSAGDSRPGHRDTRALRVSGQRELRRTHRDGQRARVARRATDVVRDDDIIQSCIAWSDVC